MPRGVPRGVPRGRGRRGRRGRGSCGSRPVPSASDGVQFGTSKSSTSLAPPDKEEAAAQREESRPGSSARKQGTSKRPSGLSKSPLAAAFAMTPKRKVATDLEGQGGPSNGVGTPESITRYVGLAQKNGHGTTGKDREADGPSCSTFTPQTGSLDSALKKGQGKRRNGASSRGRKSSRRRLEAPSDTTPIRNAFANKKVQNQPVSSNGKNSDVLPEGAYALVPYRASSKRPRKDSVSGTGSTAEESSVIWCKACRKRLSPSEVINFLGDSDGAVEEFVALIDPRLTSSLCNQDELTEQPQFKITEFTVYDEFQHVCPFDGGLIESDVPLYMSGYVKSICADDPGIEDGVPVAKVGPIVSWWTSGYDGGQNVVLGLTTAFAEYILMRPSLQYRPYIDNMQEKIYLVKVVMEFLIENDEFSYEDMLSKVEQVTGLPADVGPFTEDTVHKHAQFLIDHIQAYDAAGSSQDYPLLGSTFVQALTQVTGAIIRESTWGRKEKVSVRKKGIKKSASSVVPFLSPVVEQTINDLFTGKVATVDGGSKRQNRCGGCEACLAPDCKECVFCRNMKKYGGSGTMKQCCIRRRCGYRDIKGSEEHNDADEDAIDAEVASLRQRPFMKRRFLTSSPVEHQWLRSSPQVNEGKSFYFSVRIVHKGGDGGADFTINVGDDVQVWSILPDAVVYVGRVVALYETDAQKAFAHIVWFRRCSETVLGCHFKGAFERQVFITNECDDVPLVSMESVCKVQFPGMSIETDHCDCYICVGKCDVDHCVFANCAPDMVQALKSKDMSCPCCSFPYPVQKRGKGDASYSVGEYILVKPKAVPLLRCSREEHPEFQLRDPGDDVVRPERYRKDLAPPTVHDARFPEPYRVCLVTEVLTRSDETGDHQVSLKVQKFYRAEDIRTADGVALSGDVHLLYHTNETCEISVEDAVAKCDVMYTPTAASEGCFDATKPTFYFSKSYRCDTGEVTDVPQAAQSLERQSIEARASYSTQPLRAVDVYCGTGSLMLGLRNSGLAEPVLAVSDDAVHADTYRNNFPKCNVPRSDPKTILKRLTSSGSEPFARISLTDGVDLVCGCPSFKSLKCFRPLSANDAAKYKESPVATFLSYCAILHPKFVILAADRAVIRYSEGAVLVFIVKSLFDMGYQVSCGILQDGCYGVPQRFRRLFFFASATGTLLPSFPEPTYAFEVSDERLAFAIDGRRYSTPLSRASSSAPYRRMTLRDAIADLPPLSSLPFLLPHGSVIMTEFQRRFARPTLVNHVSKEMTPLAQARVASIPTTPGSDWRDLPNETVRLSDGTLGHRLVYTHMDHSMRMLRGVCACVNGDTRKCDPMFRQENTLIPWSLVHTADQQNHWVGLYGRLQWDGYLHTVVANPEPMSKRGPVIHPQEDRVLSVRECARVQGYPDDFLFEGTLLNQYEQVAAGVPPLVAEAVGKEFVKVIVPAFV